MMASRAVAATSLTIHEGADTQQEEDTGLTTFMILMLCSYFFVVMIGLLMAWCCCRGPHVSAEILTRNRRSVVREILVVEPERRGRTPLTNDQTIAGCCKKKHNVKPGRNASSVFLTCLECQHHATWLKAGPATFFSFPDLRFMQHAWDALQGTASSSASMVTAYEDGDDSVRRPRAPTRVAAAAADDVVAAAPAAAAKAVEGPKRTARGTAAPAAVAATAAAAAAADADTETLTATVTVIRPRPKRATRAVASPKETAAAASEELPDVDDEDWWDEATPPTTRRPTIVERAAATHRSPWTARREKEVIEIDWITYSR